MASGDAEAQAQVRDDVRPGSRSTGSNYFQSNLTTFIMAFTTPSSPVAPVTVAPTVEKDGLDWGRYRR